MIIYKVLFIVVLLFSFTSEAEPDASDSLLAITKFHEFCKQDQLITSIEIFKGIYWLPSGFSLNSSRSIEEGKLIYSNYCGAYQAYFEKLFNDYTAYPFSGVEIGNINDCGVCSEKEIKELMLTAVKLEKTTKKFSDFAMNEITMTYEGVDKYSLIVLYDKEKYMRFSGINIKYVEDGISLYEKFKKEKGER